MIEQIDIINLSHYDLGFTDYPDVCAALQRDYIDRALVLCRANRRKAPGARFCWTVESNAVLADWWAGARRAQKTELVRAVREGWIEVCALPFNKSAILNGPQWETMAHWLPEDLWRMVRPRVIMQNDVNGMQRAGVMALMDRGAEFLWMSINLDLGRSPLPQPSAFWWKMPDGRRIFVWVSISYPMGYFFFEADEWRKGPIPKASDARYREPRSGDFFECSPEYLRTAHAQCLKKIAALPPPGGQRRRLALPMTNMWRMDNDPPCALIAPFVAAWNQLGLCPKLSMTTASRALEALRADWGPGAPVMDGEWPDWWANGPMSMPREMAAARRAKRLAEALSSPLLRSPGASGTTEACMRDLCLFDEHTFGSWDNEADPWNHDARGHYAAKAVLAYRPLATLDWAIGKSLRRFAAGMKKGTLKIVNPYDKPFAGWVTLTADCLRGNYAGLRDMESGAYLPFVRKGGWAPFQAPGSMDEIGSDNLARVFSDRKKDRAVEFWVGRLEGGAEKTFRFAAGAGKEPVAPASPTIEKNRDGWPVAIGWRGDGALRGNWGEFFSLEFGGDFPRWTYKKVWAGKTARERLRARNLAAKSVKSAPGRCMARDKGPTISFSQEMRHPRLRFLRRELEVCKEIPRAKLKITLCRLPRPESAEVFYARIPLGMKGVHPIVATGGMPFQPGFDQVPKTCMDFFSIDGDVAFSSGGRQVLLSCRDNALVSFGGMHDGVGVERLEGDLSDVYAVLYNNIWYTNFEGDESGIFTFEFDICLSKTGFGGYAPEVFPVVWS